MLLRLDKVSLAYGSRPLLDQVSLQLDEGERVGLVGRNGEGKSSLLRLVRHEAEPDAGSLWLRPGARVAHLAQDIALLTGETVAQIVTAGLPQQGQALAEYQTLAAQGLHTQAQRRRLDELHHALDHSASPAESCSSHAARATRGRGRYNAVCSPPFVAAHY
ncbi:MAG: ATP-binding cassette domain-containing protein, partial [Steroidobacteraceae bacterium]